MPRRRRGVIAAARIFLLSALVLAGPTPGVTEPWSCFRSEGSDNHEVGCARYRDGGWPNFAGHAAIYYRYNYDATPPHHEVIEMDEHGRFYYSVAIVPESQFLGDSTDRGCLEPEGLTLEQRNRVIENALLLVVGPLGQGVDNYSLGDILRCKDGDDCTKELEDGSIQAEEIEEIRCDGVVEYAYEAGKYASDPNAEDPDGVPVWTAWRCNEGNGSSRCNPGQTCWWDGETRCGKSSHWNVATRDLVVHQNFGPGEGCLDFDPGWETSPVIQAGGIDQRVTTMRPVKHRDLHIQWVEWTGGRDEAIRLKFDKYVPPAQLRQKKFRIHADQSGDHAYDMEWANQGKVGVLNVTLKPTRPFAYGEHVTVEIAAQDLHDAANNPLPRDWKQTRKVDDAPPPLPESIRITEHLDPSSGAPRRRMTVRGRATYDTGRPVRDATVEIWWAEDEREKWTAPTDEDGRYSRDIAAPDRSQYVRVRVDDKGAGRGDPEENLVGENQEWYEARLDEGPGYRVVRTETCKSVGGPPLHEPRVSTPAFRTTDRRVNAWIEFADITGNGLVPQWRWYQPDGSVYDYYEGDWSGRGPIPYYNAWSWESIHGYAMADIEGRWLVKYFADVIDHDRDLVDTRTFTIRYDLQEHKMCADVDDDGVPIDPRNVFSQQDRKAATWAEFDDVAESVDVLWQFYEPTGDLYETVSDTIEDPGSDGYYPWVRAAAWIGIRNQDAERKCGQWKVDVLVTDQNGLYEKVYTDNFAIYEDPPRPPAIVTVHAPSPPVEQHRAIIAVNASDDTYLERVELHWAVNGVEHVDRWDDLIRDYFYVERPIGPLHEGDTVTYYGVAVDTSGNSVRNETRTAITVDDDVSGPEILDVDVREDEGNGDEYISDDEWVRLSWRLEDAHGISEVHCYIDGEELPVEGAYYCLGGPYPAGKITYRIVAVDGDNSPASNEALGSFVVVEDRDGDGVYDDGDESGVPGDRPCGGDGKGCDDNCPAVPNPGQEDADGDGYGDACDAVDGVAERIVLAVQEGTTGRVYSCSWEGDERELLYERETTIRAAALSHDGSRLGVLAEDGVWVIDLATGAKARVAAVTSAKPQLAWSPTDDRMVYCAEGAVWSVDAGGGAPPVRELDEGYCWPDYVGLSRGKVWLIRDDGAVVEKYPLDGEDMVLQGPGEQDRQGVRACRDGGRVAWVRSAGEDGRGTIVVRDLEELEPRDVSPDDEAAWSPAWDRTGEWIAYATADEGGWQVRKVRRDGSEVAEVWTGDDGQLQGVHAGVLTVVLDPDGDQRTNGADNCPQVANPNQADMDGDGTGDACDPDVDGDGADRYDPGEPEDTDGKPADCDDTDNAIHPDAVENGSNGVDDDCDGTIDEPETGIAMGRGWQLVGLARDDEMSASGMCDLARARGGTAERILRWDKRWRSYDCAVGLGDFDFVPGGGYFVKVKEEFLWKQEGAEYSSPFLLDLAEGWNLASLPSWTAGRTARDLCEKMEEAGCQPLRVMHWTGRWRSYDCAVGLGDFSLEEGEGFFVRVGAECTVPVEKEAR